MTRMIRKRCPLEKSWRYQPMAPREPIWPLNEETKFALLEYDIVGDTAKFLCVDGWFKTLAEGNAVLKARQGWLFEKDVTKRPWHLQRIYRLKLTPYVPMDFSVRGWLNGNKR